jgi:hypothetical protein
MSRSKSPYGQTIAHSLCRGYTTRPKRSLPCRCRRRHHLAVSLRTADSRQQQTATTFSYVARRMLRQPPGMSSTCNRSGMSTRTNERTNQSLSEYNNDDDGFKISLPSWTMRKSSTLDERSQSPYSQTRTLSGG